MIDGNNRVGGLGRILELARLSSTSKSGKTGATGESPARPQQQAGPRDIETLKLRLREQLRGVDASDEPGWGKARRVILREILAWEFGDGMRDHAEFGEMIETIERTLAGNPEARDKLNALVEDFAG